MNRKLTHLVLFGFLENLGFEDISSQSELAFVHRPTGTLLLFSSIDRTSELSNADLHSVETRLQQNGLIDQPLWQLLEQSTDVGRKDADGPA